MSRARPWSVGGLAALAGLALIAGCAHPTGYVDVRSVLTPAGEGRVASAPLEQPLRVAREVSDRNALLDVRLELLERTVGPAQIERFGKPTWVSWRWYHPLIKLPIAVSLFTPFFLAFHDPTTYGGGEWTRWDYFHDVGAWFNLCSAMPTDSREVGLAEERILVKPVVAVTAERRVPIPGRSVLLSLDGREIARGVSDAKGAVRFDLGPFLTPALAQGSHTLRLVSPVPGGEAAELTRTLAGQTVKQLLEIRPAASRPAP